MGILDRLDALDRRIIPDRWRTSSPESLRSTRRFLTALVVLNAAVAIEALVTRSWLKFAISTAIVVGWALLRGPYWSWIERRAAARSRGGA